LVPITNRCLCRPQPVSRYVGADAQK